MRSMRRVLLALAVAVGTTVGLVTVNAGADDPHHQHHPVHHNGHHHLCHAPGTAAQREIVVSTASAEAYHLKHGDGDGFCPR